MEEPGGNRRHGRPSRLGATTAVLAALAPALLLAACGGGDSSDSDEAAGSYPVKVLTAEFPTRQRVGETVLLRLGVRNTGDRALPALTVTISVGSKEEGRSSALPFGYRDPSPEIAQPDRPVWALAAGYPKIDGSEEPGGAETSNPKTFDFGPLDPGFTTEAVWKLSAVRTGRYRLFYEIGAGLGGKAEAEAAGGTEAGGSFTTRITEVPPDVVVKDNGEVVPAPKPPNAANR